MCENFMVIRHSIKELLVKRMVMRPMKCMVHSRLLATRQLAYNTTECLHLVIDCWCFFVCSDTFSDDEDQWDSPKPVRGKVLPLVTFMPTPSQSILKESSRRKPSPVAPTSQNNFIPSLPLSNTSTSLHNWSSQIPSRTSPSSVSSPLLRLNSPGPFALPVPQTPKGKSIKESVFEGIASPLGKSFQQSSRQDGGHLSKKSPIEVSSGTNLAFLYSIRDILILMNISQGFYVKSSLEPVLLFSLNLLLLS